MPLTPKGEEILTHMKGEYGSSKKAEEVFYASRNAGKISGVDEGLLPRLQGPPEDPNVMGPSELTQPSGPKEPTDFAGMCADQNYERDALSPMGKLPLGMSLDGMRGWKP